MKRFGVALVALLLVLATAVPAVAADPVRPFRGSWTSLDGFDLAAPGCPAGALLRYSTAGQGEFVHLGLTTVTMTHCTFVGPGPLEGWFDVGPVTLTAANGDVLVLGHRGTFTLVPNPGAGPPFASATSTIDWWVESGTGRFAHAGGSGTGGSFDDMIAGVQSFRLSGSIAY
jgi:hypothetical protein